MSISTTLIKSNTHVDQGPHDTKREQNSKSLEKQLCLSEVGKAFFRIDRIDIFSFLTQKQRI